MAGFFALGAFAADFRAAGFFAALGTGLPRSQTPTPAPSGSTKMPIAPISPISWYGMRILAPAFSAFAMVFLTLATST